MDGFYRDSLLKLIPFIQMILERYCAAKEQATTDFFGRSKFNLYSLASTESLESVRKSFIKRRRMYS